MRRKKNQFACSSRVSWKGCKSSHTVLGNFWISWTAGVMNRALRALNSQIINFKRFDPQQLLGVTKGQLWRSGPCAVGTGVPGLWHHPADWLPVTSLCYSASCLHFSFSLPGTSGPHTAPRREERAAHRAGPATPTSRGHSKAERPLASLWMLVFWAGERGQCNETNQGSQA